MSRFHSRRLVACVLAPTLVAGASVLAQQALDPAILDDPSRSADDRYRDEGFKPLEVYAFFGVRPGRAVGDLWTSSGYNAHILARAVGPEGSVVAIISPYPPAPERAARATASLSERFAGAGLDNVSVVGSLADVPDDSLDVLITVRNYHDLGEKADRLAAMPELMRVLKPGGILGVVDADTDKTGERDESVHRINEELAKAEITSAGFALVATSDVLYNPEDTFDFDGRERAGVRGATRDAPIHRYFIQRWVHSYRKPSR